MISQAVQIRSKVDTETGTFLTAAGIAEVRAEDKQEAELGEEEQAEEEDEDVQSVRTCQKRRSGSTPCA